MGSGIFHVGRSFPYKAVARDSSSVVEVTGDTLSATSSSQTMFLHLAAGLTHGLWKATTALLDSQMISRLKLLSSNPEMFSTSITSRSLHMLSDTFSSTTAELWTVPGSETRRVCLMQPLQLQVRPLTPEPLSLWKNLRRIKGIRLVHENKRGDINSDSTDTITSNQRKKRKESLELKDTNRK
ncbi:hypothetical protein INR49_018835 [Caranx melampygus]|nr:hypothetical protein INR49_018835 [Caranx melampygus]